MGPSPLPRITIADALVTAEGIGTLQPSHRDWKRRRAYWRVLDASGRPLSGWRLTPRLALLSASKSAPSKNKGLVP